MNEDGEFVDNVTSNWFVGHYESDDDVSSTSTSGVVTNMQYYEDP
jgi:hypothetical protein